MLKEVTVSGTVGKQVYATTIPIILKGFTLTPSAANATIKIRDGDASGDVRFFGRTVSAGGSSSFSFGKIRFDRGMHVKIIGAAAVAYLDVE